MHVVLHENEILGIKVMIMEKIYIFSGVLRGEESSNLALIARMRSVRDRRRSTVTQKKELSLMASILRHFLAVSDEDVPLVVFVFKFDMHFIMISNIHLS